MGDLSKTAQGILSRIEDDSRINKNNKKYINDFVIFCRSMRPNNGNAIQIAICF